MTTAVVEEAALVLGAIFTAHDRCDRCCAEARVRAILRAGELLLCGHHGRQHRAALEAVALQVFDAPPLPGGPPGCST